MKKIRLLLIAIFITSVITGFAQSGELKGIIVDNETNEHIPFAAVSVFSENFEKLIHGDISNGNGEFEIENTGFGAYNIVVVVNGYEPDTLEKVLVSRETSPVDLGEIRIFPAVVHLEDLKFSETGQTATRKIDRQTYRVSDFKTADNGTAVDVLNRLPAVSVAPDGTVLLRGTTALKVYLNGKPTHLEPSVLLGLIPSNSIDSIDLIAVPTAHFVAQGKSGIINISTITSGPEGLSAGANVMAGGAPWNDVTGNNSGYDLTANRYNVGANAVFRKNRLTFYGGLNHSKRNFNVSHTGEARLLQPNGSWFHMISDGNRPEWVETYSANAGFDFRFSELNAFSASYYFGRHNKERSAFYVYNNFFAGVDKNPINGIPMFGYWMYNSTTDNRDGIFHRANISFSHKFINKSQLQLSLLYEHSALERGFKNRFYDFENTAGEVGELQRFSRGSDDTPLNGYRFSLEYKIPLGNGGILGAGFQPEYIEQEGGFNSDTLNVVTNAWEADAFRNNYLNFTRTIYAGYVDYSGGWGDFDFIAGMRVEYTDQVLEMANLEYLGVFEIPRQQDYELNQLNWFPTLHVQYDINEKNVFIFAASRRINRPPVRKMTAFPYPHHYNVYDIGNPSLEPENLSNLELSLNHRMGKQDVTLTGFIRGTNNAIFRMNAVNEDENVLVRSYTNAGNVRAVGGEFNSNLVASGWARFFIGGSVYNFQVESGVYDFRENYENTNWSLNGNMNLLLTPELALTLDADYRSEMITAQGRNEHYYLSAAALNYTPQKLPKWDFGLKVLDVFGSGDTGFNSQVYNPAGTQIYYREAQYNRLGTVVELSATFSFNRSDNIRKEESLFVR